MKTLLNIGSGPVENSIRLPDFFRTGDWREVRLDLNPNVNPDVLSSITDMRSVPSASVQAIWCSHCLEHLYGFEVATALGEFLRVLSSDGFAILKVPDLQTVAEMVANDQLDQKAYESAAGPITPHDMIYGHGAALAAGHFTMAHRTGFTPRTLGTALQAAGFAIIALGRPTFLDLAALAFKQVPEPAIDYGRFLNELTL